MGRGPSGRIVVEIEPQLKRALYAELSRHGLTFKDWLVFQAKEYIRDGLQPNLFTRETTMQPLTSAQ